MLVNKPKELLMKDPQTPNRKERTSVSALPFLSMVRELLSQERCLFKKKIPFALCKAAGIKDRIASMKFPSPSEQVSLSACQQLFPWNRTLATAMLEDASTFCGKAPCLDSFNLICRSGESKDAHEFFPKPDSLLHGLGYLI